MHLVSSRSTYGLPFGKVLARVIAISHLRVFTCMDKLQNAISHAVNTSNLVSRRGTCLCGVPEYRTSIPGREAFGESSARCAGQRGGGRA
jgi:hypothetical protein